VLTRGAFGNDGAASLNSIPDGTSNTLGIGESRQGQYHTSSNYGPYWGQGLHTAVHGYILPTYNTQCAIDYPYGVPNKQYAWQYGSAHGFGANFVFLDGSVHFLTDDINYPTFAALATPSGAEMVGDY
jgi:prepilin-type processing-associated H-X9-DG protein